MKSEIHKSETRGGADHGWLKARHSFSFANWYEPTRLGFGVLRVLNDDIIAPKMGFSAHGHDNMEIITIPLSGTIHHKDSMGNEGDINSGEIQVMSAGSGIMHSEFNPSQAELRLFQIWIIPNKKNVQPRYDQFKIDTNLMHNNFLQLVSPNKDDAGSWIHQDAWIHMAELDEGTTLTYNLKKKGNGIYSLVIEGQVEINDTVLDQRDAIGITDTLEAAFSAKSKSKLLVLEVPMNS